MLEELDYAVLLVDLPQQQLIAGDTCTVLLVHNNGQAYTVEFAAQGEGIFGEPFAIETLSETQLRLIHPDEIQHIRQRTVGDRTISHLSLLR